MATFSMTPLTGEKVVRFVGDRLRFTLQADAPLPSGWRGFLRTDLGRAATLRSQIIHSHFRKLPLAGAQWHDVPMQPDGTGGWFVELTLAETGYFRAKAYALDPEGRQHWPHGADLGVGVHPDRYRTANTIYCAFVRQFGANRTLATTDDPKLGKKMHELDKLDYAVIPPSGKLRDLTKQLPHIVNTLGSRIVHLLPVNPTPTTKARFGRFGSPYASQDLLAIDPAIVEHENATTGIDQFKELARATHALGARLIIDLAINHTGWGSTLQENHPEWFLRDPKTGEFVSPGAWGTTWGDLVELEQTHVELWQHLAGVFLEWCRRGVDGFRCDAGYKVPMPAWQFIIARVREEFPDALFLLEGLGGAWVLTEDLLGDGSMQWAYSELFQEFSGAQVQGYLDHALKQSQRVGVLVHYSETHDNNRLAASKPDGRAWSLLRNRLSALTSISGGFAFHSGVEWLAKEKVRVHEANGLNWGAAENIVPELARLNQLLAEHPAFFDGAKLTRLSPPGSPVYALQRDSADGAHRVTIAINLDETAEQTLALDAASFRKIGEPGFDLITQKPLPIEARSSRREEAPTEKATAQKPGDEKPSDAVANSKTPPLQNAVFEKAGDALTLRLPPAGVVCLTSGAPVAGTAGHDYRTRRAQAAWAVQQLAAAMPMEQIGSFDWRELAAWTSENPERLLAAASRCSAEDRSAGELLLPQLQEAASAGAYSPVTTWSIADVTRIFLVPPQHWLLVRDTASFRVTLKLPDGTLRHAESIAVNDGYIAGFGPAPISGDAELHLERYGGGLKDVSGTIRFLAATPQVAPVFDDALVLLTNGIGGMARLGVDLGAIRSKYDCALGANLHATLPVDRHVFVKRIRAWCNADGFISPLNAQNLVAFTPGPPARWSFVANAGDGRSVPIELEADMIAGQNTTAFRFSRPSAPPTEGRALPENCRVTLILRVDIEDRSFHSQTQRNGGSEHHFRSNSRAFGQSGTWKAENGKDSAAGFEFTPAADRQLRVFCDAGTYHPGEEWSHCEHPVEVTRGQEPGGDAFSPGWFEVTMRAGDAATLTLTAETLTAETRPEPADAVENFAEARAAANGRAIERAGFTDDFGKALALAAPAFVVRRDDGRTVIAGYPWFLDWGRDSLICARGLLAAGMLDEVRQLLVVFGRFEENGTLPNTIHGANASNRDTSDAPLWYGVVCEELASLVSSKAKGQSSREEPAAKDQLVNEAAGQLKSGPLNFPGALAFDLCSSSPLYDVEVDSRKRTLSDVLRSLAAGILRGAPNGIRVDAGSCLVWSPSHFTWMDTNFPAGTPREGYPVEIQVLWIRLLRQLERIGAKPETEAWGELAARAEKSFNELFWLESKGWFADVLLAKPGVSAKAATPDDALRSNMLFAVTLGVVGGERARRCVDVAAQWLVIPGALRSLAPLEVSVPLEIRANNGGGIINDPPRPYWPRYEGDEDTRRKPAYHNGTAWTWTFPSFCEALAMAHGFEPEAVAAARAYLGSADRLLGEGCLGQLPEILDGDAPHTQRGCDAQAWGATEALRVWKLLNGPAAE